MFEWVEETQRKCCGRAARLWNHPCNFGCHLELGVVKHSEPGSIKSKPGSWRRPSEDRGKVEPPLNEGEAMSCEFGRAVIVTTRACSGCCPPGIRIADEERVIQTKCSWW